MGRILHGSFRFSPALLRWVGLLVLVLMLYQILQAIRHLGDLVQVSRRYAAEQERLDARWQAVNRDLVRSRDHRGVLRVARRDLAMARPGEVPVIFQAGVRSHVMEVPSAPTAPPVTAGRD